MYSTTIFSFSMEIINNLTQTEKRPWALARDDFFDQISPFRKNTRCKRSPQQIDENWFQKKSLS